LRLLAGLGIRFVFDFFCLRGACLSGCLRRWGLFDLFVCAALFVCAFMVLAFP
jgi:hypothetical protein